ncbi:MAG: hypothetical protein EBR14_04520, partial [Methylophilaceae bacterium]|nr:hypothetical protein [Methylophilaceae bacterium]
KITPEGAIDWARPREDIALLMKAYFAGRDEDDELKGRSVEVGVNHFESSLKSSTFAKQTQFHSVSIAFKFVCQARVVALSNVIMRHE